ncbi:hypothetical protein [Desulfurobacterium sp.]
MTTETELVNLLELLEKENRLLKKGIAEPGTADELFKISEEKRKLLSKLARLEAGELQPFRDLIEKIEKLNERNTILLLNNMDILEETVKSLLPEEYASTYSRNGELTKTRSIFGKKV